MKQMKKSKVKSLCLKLLLTLLCPVAALTQTVQMLDAIKAVGYNNLVSELLSLLCRDEKSTLSIDFLDVSCHFAAPVDLCEKRSIFGISSTFLHLNGNFLPKSPQLYSICNVSLTQYKICNFLEIY